jgi:hypothetical protein
MHLWQEQAVRIILFLGSFGTILYTGDIRYDPVMLENRVLAHVIEHEVC